MDYSSYSYSYNTVNDSISFLSSNSLEPGYYGVRFYDVNQNSFIRFDSLLYIVEPKVTYIDHNSGNPGELLSVSISTENMQFGAFSTIPQFKLVPTSYVANTGASEVTGIFTSF